MKYLFPTVFITGGIVLVLEILGTRIIAPYYGTTLYVWSSLITVALVFLSLGYLLGGALADRKPDPGPLYLIIFFSGLSIIFIPSIASKVLILTSPLGSRFGALASAFVLFGIPMTLLGMVAPYAIRLKTTMVDTVGVTAGGLYAVGTIGSFAGALLTGFYLIPSLDIRTIIYLTSFSLFIVSGGWFLAAKRYRLLLALPLLLVILFHLTYPAPAMAADSDPKIVYKTESLYGQIKVVDYRDRRYLLFNGASQTIIDKRTGESRMQYSYGFYHSVSLNPEAETALLIGLGGGAVPGKFTELGVDMDVIEIDSKVVDIAREYFGFTGDAIVDDGRHYIKNTGKQYDIILFDAFSAFTPAPHLLTIEAIQESREILSHEGLLVLNTMGWIEGENSKLQKAIYKTLKQVFPYVYVVPINPQGFDNVLFYASEIPLEIRSYGIGVDKDTPVLTDNYNPTEFLALKGAEEGRNITIRFFGAGILIQ